jgi:hypothetical protein
MALRTTTCSSFQQGAESQAAILREGARIPARPETSRPIFRKPVLLKPGFFAKEV